MYIGWIDRDHIDQILAELRAKFPTGNFTIREGDVIEVEGLNLKQYELALAYYEGCYCALYEW